MNNQIEKESFLETNLFYGLNNLNDGFDIINIKYFSATEFEIVLNRVEQLNIGIYGIESWKDGEFYDVLTCEDFSKGPTDPKWYKMAFEKFKLFDSNLLFSASYYVPQ